MRKKGKKEIIVKIVFSCITVFMLWWAFLIWERFLSDVAVDKSIDDVGMIMLWYDIQNKRYIPNEATIEDFDLQIDSQKNIAKYAFTVYGKKEGESFNFSYTEQRGEDYTFEQTPVEGQASNHLRATTFFQAIQLLQIKQMITEETQILFRAEGTDSLQNPTRVWKIEGDALTEIQADVEQLSGYEKCYLVSGDETEWLYIKV